jgi:DNA/RNA endonuclease YhcR with UshA esterase domain
MFYSLRINGSNSVPWQNHVRILALVISLAGGVTLPPGARADSKLTVVEAAAAMSHLGETVTVEGTIVAAFTSSKGSTFLNFGAAYPNQTFTGWIPRSSELSGSPLLTTLQGKRVKLTGTVELYNGRPEIRLMHERQIEIEGDKGEL